MRDVVRKRNDDVLADYRNEIKVPLDRAQLNQFLPSLYQLGLFPSTPFPDRRINSVYYDCSGFTDYTDNVSGTGDRRKTRIRWYNGELSKLTHEQKIKKGKVSRKESFKIDNPSALEPHTKSGLNDILKPYEKAVEAIMMGPLFPTLEVQYDRQYFTLAPDLRMTIDRDQKFRRLYPTPATDFVDSSVFAVVEFKFPAVQRPKMQSILRDLPFRVFRHSKYVIGMDSTVY